MPYEEDGTQSGATKVKNEQGSYNKKNVKKSGFQQRNPRQPSPTLSEDLTGATFSDLRPATFKKIIKRLLGYATLKYRHYTIQAVQTFQPKTFVRPAKPSNDGIADNPDVANYWWQAKCKEMMAEKRTYISNLLKMFTTVLGCYDEDLLGKVRNRSDFD